MAVIQGSEMKFHKVVHVNPKMPPKNPENLNLESVELSWLTIEFLVNPYKSRTRIPHLAHYNNHPLFRKKFHRNVNMKMNMNRAISITRSKWRRRAGTSPQMLREAAESITRSISPTRTQIRNPWQISSTALRNHKSEFLTRDQIQLTWKRLFRTMLSERCKAGKYKMTSKIDSLPLKNNRKRCLKPKEIIPSYEHLHIRNQRN